MTATPSALTVETLARAKKHLLHCVNPQPVVLHRAHGSEVWDVEDRRYIDLLGGLAVTGLGHCHEAVVAAIEKQARQLMHVSNMYASAPMINLAEKLCHHSFAQRVFFCNSGTEANETALKTARKYFQAKGEPRTEFITAHNSFHGRTLGSLSATGQEQYRTGFEPLVPGFKYAPFGDLDALAGLINSKTAAVMLEPIQGEGGMVVPPQGYLKNVRELTQDLGCLLILDEIQSGMGRTGTLFAYEQEDLVPDMVTVAKGLGNGVPIGAMLTTNDISSVMVSGTHASTFGGNPLTCAAACAVMDVLTAPGFLKGVVERGALLRQHLEALAKKHAPFTGEVRGRGMWLGCELHGDATKLVHYAREQGVLVNIIHGHVLRLAPALTLSHALMTEGLEKLSVALSLFVENEKPAPRP